MEIGRFEVTSHNLGFFRLDGGAMFGAVPKNIWGKLLPPDEENCNRLATRSLLIRDKKKNRTFLVDVGMGEKWSDKSRKIFAIDNLPESSWGFSRNEITDIILTHLHFDHAGGISRFSESNPTAIELSFPKATIHLQQENWFNAKSPNLREKASYLKENIDPLEKGNLSLVGGTVEIYPDIWVHECNGHTRGQQWIEIRSEKQIVTFPTDLIPTSHHLPVPYNMGYDICAETILREKEEFLSYVMKNQAIVVFQHDPNLSAAKITKNEKGHYCVGEAITI